MFTLATMFAIIVGTNESFNRIKSNYMDTCDSEKEFQTLETPVAVLT